MQIRPINSNIAVAPQLLPDELADVAARGFRVIINNRPDDEEPGQPGGAEMRAAATMAGLSYYEIPVTHAGFSLPQVEAMVAAQAAADGPVLAYCRSGTRSCNLWALAAARQGLAIDEIIAQGASAGYDLTAIRPLLDQLAPHG